MHEALAQAITQATGTDPRMQNHGINGIISLLDEWNI